METREKEAEENIKIESVRSCPVCGSEGSIVLEHCRDYICNLPGTWTFRQCQQCNSLWLDPRPTQEAIPSLYPDNYCFTRNQPVPPFQLPQGFGMQLRFSTKLAILERAYGYTGLSRRVSSPISSMLGKFLSFLPGLSQWAGYTVRFLHQRSPGRLLEVGSGNGKFLWLMSELGWEAVGIEPDPQAAKVSASNGLKVMPCTLDEAELAPFSYDAITLHHVLEHLPDPKVALSKLAECLKPGGVLVSISPNPTGALAHWFRSSWYELDAPRHLVLPSTEGYKHMLEQLGFQVNIWTTMQIAFWVCRESLSIQRTGQVGSYQGRLLPKLVSIVSALLLLTFPNMGEEVVCVAVKN